MSVSERQSVTDCRSVSKGGSDATKPSQGSIRREGKETETSFQAGFRFTALSRETSVCILALIKLRWIFGNTVSIQLAQPSGVCGRMDPHASGCSGVSSDDASPTSSTQRLANRILTMKEVDSRRHI